MATALGRATPFLFDLDHLVPEQSPNSTELILAKSENVRVVSVGAL
jgi:hypothetical protein